MLGYASSRDGFVEDGDFVNMAFQPVSADIEDTTATDVNVVNGIAVIGSRITAGADQFAIVVGLEV
jgi:hypothetical protein